MFRRSIPSTSLRLAARPHQTLACSSRGPTSFLCVNRQRRGYATEAGELQSPDSDILGLTCCSVDERDLVIIGGGVAGYVAAIKAGQEGLKVS